MSEKGPKPFIPLGTGGEALPGQPFNRPSREEANAAKWSRRVGAAAAERAASTVAGNTVATPKPWDSIGGTHEGMARANGADDLDIAIMQGDKARMLKSQRETIEKRKNSPEVSLLNDAAELELFGSKGRDYVHPQTGEKIFSRDRKFVGKLDRMLMDDRYGKNPEKRLEARKNYESHLNELLDSGLELAQAHMLAEAKDPVLREERLQQLVNKRAQAGQNRVEARKEAESQLDRADKKREELVREGLFSPKDYHDYIKSDTRAKREKQPSADDAPTQPLRRTADPNARAQLPTRDLTERHNASRARMAQEKEGFFKKHWKKLGAAAVAVAAGLTIWAVASHDNDRAPEAPAAVQIDAPNGEISAVELAPDKYPTVFDTYVHEHNGDVGAAMSALNQAVDSSTAKNEVRKVFLPGTDNYGDALWKIVTPDGNDTKRAVIPPLADEPGGVKLAPNALEAFDEEQNK